MKRLFACLQMPVYKCQPNIVFNPCLKRFTNFSVWFLHILSAIFFTAFAIQCIRIKQPFTPSVILSSCYVFQLSPFVSANYFYYIFARTLIHIVHVYFIKLFSNSIKNRFIDKFYRIIYLTYTIKHFRETLCRNENLLRRKIQFTGISIGNKLLHSGKDYGSKYECFAHSHSTRGPCSIWLSSFQINATCFRRKTAYWMWRG